MTTATLKRSRTIGAMTERWSGTSRRANRAEIGSEPDLGVVPREGAEAYRDAHAAEDPTYGVAGLAGGDDGAYHREGERQDGQRDQAVVVWTLWNARPGHQSEREPAHEQHH